jgi:hypothetical protein
MDYSSRNDPRRNPKQGSVGQGRRERPIDPGRFRSSPPSVARPVTSAQPVPAANSAPLPKNKISSKVIIIAGIVIVCLAALLVAGYFAFQPHSAIPKAVSSRASFGIFVPGNDEWTVDTDTVRYTATSGLVSYVMHTKGNANSISVNEQATPEAFNDVPQAYDKLISSLQGYSTITSVNGKVDLTHPKELNGGQAAVMNAKGTLMFAKPDRSLTTEDWRRLFNQLQLQR